VTRGPKIGTFSITIEISYPGGERYEAVEALVDTGATHTMLPREPTDTLGISAVERLEFRLADQSIESYDVGEARVRLDGRERTVPVVFGPEGAGAPLGATTLEIFHLAADPMAQRLLPTQGLLTRISAHRRSEVLPGCATFLRCGELGCATLLRCGVTTWGETRRRVGTVGL
jgi:clan AA aspartic protease